MLICMKELFSRGSQWTFRRSPRSAIAGDRAGAVWRQEPHFTLPLRAPLGAAGMKRAEDGRDDVSIILAGCLRSGLLGAKMGPMVLSH